MDYELICQGDYNRLLYHIRTNGIPTENTKEFNFFTIDVDRRIIPFFVDTQTQKGLRNAVYKETNFTVYNNPKAWYNGYDYKGVLESFIEYCFFEKKGYRNSGRRQHSFSFGEKLCMNGMQIFEDRNMLILNFRSCDAVNKLPYDLSIINSMCDDFELNISRFFCVFGSLHIYNGD